jgi:hypothetical protein
MLRLLHVLMAFTEEMFFFFDVYRVTLGNQVDGVKLLDPDIVRAFKKVYPDGNCMKPPAPS